MYKNSYLTVPKASWQEPLNRKKDPPRENLAENKPALQAGRQAGLGKR